MCWLQFHTYLLLKEPSPVPTTNSWDVTVREESVWEWHQNLYPCETVVWTTTVADGLKCSSAQAKPDAWQLHGWRLLQLPLYWRQLAHTRVLVLQCLSLELNLTDQADSESWSWLHWSMTWTFFFCSAPETVWHDLASAQGFFFFFPP